MHRMTAGVALQGELGVNKPILSVAVCAWELVCIGSLLALLSTVGLGVNKPILLVTVCA